MDKKIADAKVKAGSAKPESGKPETAPPAAKPGRTWRPRWSRKLAMLTGFGVLLAGCSAAGAWYAAQDLKPPPGRPEQHQKPAAKPLFITLDLFTVNLQDPYTDRIAQIGVTLQFDDPALEVTIKDRLPAVRNSILLLISSKQVDELLTTEGKQQLARQIQVRAARAIGVDVPEPDAPAARNPAAENPIRAVLFSHFIVQ